MGQALSNCLNPPVAPKERKPAPPEEEEDNVKPPENVKCAADIDFLWPRNFAEKYTIQKAIGQGCFAEVSLVKSVETGEEMAVKTILKQKVFEDYSLYEDIKKEASIMEIMNHCLNTCTLYGKFEDDTGVMLVMELCTGKDLFEHLHAHEYSERSAARVAREVLRMLAACHHRGVVHRDIKPENLIFSRDAVDAPLKVIDFGLSTFCAADKTMDEIVGTPFYIAPEALAGQFCQKSEVWALGCILYKLLSGRDPFMRNDIQQCLMAISAANVEFESDPWPRVSEEGKAFVRLLLTKDPKGRPTALEALENEWVMREERTPGEERVLDDTIIQRLQRYSDLVADRKTALTIVSAKLINFDDQDHAVRDAHRLFKKMDRSGDGHLSREEFRQGLREQGYQLSDHEINLLEAQLDLESEDSSITFSRFLTFACPWEQLSERPGFLQSVMKTTFQDMDKDSDGIVHRADIQAYLDRHAELGNPLHPKGFDTVAYADHLLNLWDKSHAGHVTLESFDRTMQALSNQDVVLPMDAYESRLPKDKPWKVNRLASLRKTLSRLSSTRSSGSKKSDRLDSSMARTVDDSRNSGISFGGARSVDASKASGISLDVSKSLGVSSGDVSANKGTPVVHRRAASAGGLSRTSSLKPSGFKDAVQGIPDPDGAAIPNPNGAS